MQQNPHNNQLHHTNQVHQSSEHHNAIKFPVSTITMAQLEVQQLQLSQENSTKNEIVQTSSEIFKNGARPIVIQIDKKKNIRVLDISSFPPLSSEVSKRLASQPINLPIPTKESDKKSKNQLIYSNNRSHHNFQAIEHRTINKDTKLRYTVIIYNIIPDLRNRDSMGS